MISGGLIGGGDWCIGDYCTSVDIIGETISDAAKATYENVIEPVGSGIATAAVSTYDFFDTVASTAFWGYYVSDPQRVFTAMADWYGDSSNHDKKLLAVLPFLPISFVEGWFGFSVALSGVCFIRDQLWGLSAFEPYP